MNFKIHTLEELEAKRNRLSSRLGLVGLDGFVDRIVKPVAIRSGTGDNYTPIETISDFARRIEGASGKSTNIELVPREHRLGGNGPIMAHALLAAGMKVRYIGALGVPEIHPVFQEFAQKSEAYSIAAPGVTDAVEFSDGKLLLNTTSTLEAVTYEAIIGTVGEGKFFDLFSRLDLIGMVNWTMVPAMTDILSAFLDKVLPNLPSRDQRTFFFDLADPEKRSDSDIKSALLTIKRFQSYGKTILGMNLKEAQIVARVLGIKTENEDEDGLKRLTTRIRQELSLGVVAVHPRDSAVCATREDAWWVPGPYTETPVLTTGAGDHFNAGFALGQTLGMTPLASLTLGVCFSGYMVRKARSPSLNEIDSFLRNWKE
jgi:hypothetical protein